jgi:hypothetical protein
MWTAHAPSAIKGPAKNCMVQRSFAHRLPSGRKRIHKSLGVFFQTSDFSEFVAFSLGFSGPGGSLLHGYDNFANLLV